jgi:hypothetical protein
MKIATLSIDSPIILAARLAYRLGCELRFIDGRVWLWRPI